MILKLEIFDSYCSTKDFKINLIDAVYEDFGEKFDRNSLIERDYHCGCMKFTRINSTKEILDKYKITEEEYQEICDKLEEGLSFGKCDCCR